MKKSMTAIATATLLALGLSVASAGEPSVGAEGMYQKGTYEGTPWISGGVGKNEREYLLEHHAGDNNLKIEFAVSDGTYLADVDVMIAKPDGEVVMKAHSSGPWFMTKLPAGTYEVQASGFGQTFDASVSVPATGLETVVFNQWTRPEVAEETPGPGL